MIEPVVPARRRARVVAAACAPVWEDLEQRNLFSGSTIQALPFVLDFGSDRGELFDTDGQGTGFTRVQGNRLGTEYQPALIDLDTAAGVLRMTTSGSSTTGSNSGTTDNTMVNGLETQFDGTGAFTITARLKGPLGYLNASFDQGGIYFGPDQDNFIKLVAVRTSSGNYLQFKDEFGGSTTSVLPAAAQTYSIGSFTSINTLDVRLTGNASTGVISAYFSINGNSTFTKVPYDLTLTGANRAAFFNAASRAGIMQFTKNDGPAITVNYDSFSITSGAPITGRPYVTSVRPRDGVGAVSRDAFVACDIVVPSAGNGIDAATLFGNVKLYRTSDRALIAGVANTSGGGDAIVFQPSALLDPNTSYTFEITAGVQDTAGNAFVPFTSTFTTGTAGGTSNPALAFDQIHQAAAAGQSYTCVTIGPDHRLYASTIDGLIQRFNIGSDGTLSMPETFTTVQTNNGGPRAITGIVFDPNATASNLVLWVSHSAAALSGAADWTGKISKLSGASLQNYQDMVVGLPRSVRDHMNNQLIFGPDGKIYFAQASNTAMGAPDTAWGMRGEHLLNAAILQLDPARLGSTPLNVQTEGVANPYNPFASGAPLKIYATGVRNAYDLLWDSNGHLYAPTNGSAANGSTPGSPNPAFSNNRIDEGVYGDYTGPVVPGITGVTDTEHDWLFDVDPLKYYGHPNPSRYEWVLNGGNPTSGVDPYEVAQYPVGTQPDRNYQAPAFDFGQNYSPDGIVEYHGSAFGGALDGKIMVVRYSGGDDILVLTPNADGSIASAESGIAGLGHFVDPLDLTEDNASGFVYVAEYGGQRITLLKPIAPGAHAVVNKSTFYFNDVQASVSGGSSAAQTLTITNTGTSALALPTDGLTITGPNAMEFAVTGGNLPATIDPGQSITLNLTFTAAALGIRTATLTIKSNDAANPLITINLRGLGTTGTGGTNEPSLQRILDLFQIPVNVGDDNPNDTAFPQPPISPNDEVLMQQLQKAGDGPVTVELLATFVNNKTPAVHFGYYDPGTPSDKTELFIVPRSSDAQSVAPGIKGVTSFDPSTGEFSLYGVFPAFTNREVYSEDALNTWEANVANRRKVRFYPLKNSDGTVVPNAYVFAFEEYNVTYDQNDIVGIIRNVKAAPAGPEIGLANGDGAPFDNRLVFNRIAVLDSDWPNMVHDKSVLTIRNTGSDPLTINSLVLGDTTNFTIVGGIGSTPFDIPAGGSQNITIQFIGTGSGNNKTFISTLTINSNDADEPAKTVKLAGWWQSYSENSPGGTYVEPTLQDVIKVLGYGTKVTIGDEVLDTGGQGIKAGEETLSPYWFRVDSNAPVAVRLLAAFHRQNNTDAVTGAPTNAASTISYYFQGSSTTPTKLFQHNQYEGQSLLPHLSGSTTNYAIGTFTPTGSTPFGFKVDTRYSDDTLNPLDNGQAGTGHSFRFYAAKDANGNLIPNTYIVAQDYTALSYSNYDYQDNIYLITNVRPASAPTAPLNANANGSSAGVTVTWDANHEGNVAGYRIYRSDAADGVYTLLTTSTLLTSSIYTDIAAPDSVVSYYKITAVDVNGSESPAAFTSAARTNDTSPPATPAGLTAHSSGGGIVLDWSDNLEPDLAGYDVYRSDAPDGTFIKLNDTHLTSSNFSDATAPIGATSYYRVVAVDTTGNTSSDATVSATRTVDTTPPATPGGLTATGQVASIVLNWNDNTESDLAGYDVYRSDSPTGTFTKLNDVLLTTSAFTDAAAPRGVTSYYRVVAVDATGNVSANATASAFRPAVGIYGRYNTLAYDSTGRLHFAWYDAADKHLKYTSRTAAGVWSAVQIVDPSGDDTGQMLSIAVDKQNHVGIAYFDATSSDMRYASLSGSTWKVQTVDSRGSVGGYPSLVFDRNNLPSISYFFHTSDDLRYAHWNGAKWLIWDVDTAGSAGRSTSMAMNPKTGLMSIAYEDSTHGWLRFAQQDATGKWAEATVDASTKGVAFMSQAYDASGRPAVSYYAAGFGDLKFATTVSGKWKYQTVVSKGAVGYYSQLHFDPKTGKANILYYNRDTDDVQQATGLLGSTWSLSTKQTAGGKYISAAFGPSTGRVSFIWSDATEDILRVTDLN